MSGLDQSPMRLCSVLCSFAAADAFFTCRAAPSAVHRHSVADAAICCYHLQLLMLSSFVVAQPDALFVIIPALTLPTQLAAASYISMFVVGTVAAMGGYTAVIGE